MYNSPLGEHDRVGEPARHPKTFWAPNKRPVCPGDRDEFSSGASRPQMYLH